MFNNMLLFSPPQCNLLLAGRPGKQTTFTTQRATLSSSSSPERPANSLVALRSLQDILLPQSPPASHKSQQSPVHVMTSPQKIPNTHGSPRTPTTFSPTLGSIQEVFEYEPLDITSQPPTPLTPLENEDGTPAVMPEPATTAKATVSMGPKTRGIIVSPRKSRTAVASTKVANVLRNVLEADRLRRRRILRIYLKAIVFLKLLVKSHERYGAIMATSGIYMQR
ncbi:hypothetical protein IQ06DRAFT_295784 [Phaeosphaeriaceae sp. SRC1lsM3a]|nr:hypothetical protein IQ06DRAFT_295784 [Stagonospora sp. SRC1lsM3a]